MENKKNTILLTVIAVATLLVAVVGATFAYFTAQGGTGTSANVTVTTGTAASSEFGTFGDINIHADATTFAKGKPDATGTTTGTVSWTAPGATTTTTPSEADTTTTTTPIEADRSFCYTADLIITANTFTKSAANTANAKELYFTAVKGSTTLVDEQSLVTLPAGTAVTGTINIPTTKGGEILKHKLIAEAGKTVSDSWTITVTLKNLDIDQNENTGKQLTGSIKFTKVAC